MMTRLLAWLLSLSLLAGGCGDGAEDSDDDGGTDGNASGGTAGSAGAATAACDETTPVDVPDISGRWAYLEIQTKIVQSSYMDDVVTQVVSLMLFEQTQNGSSFTAEASWCDRYTHDPDSDVRSVLPNDYVQALDPLTWRGSYVQDADGVWRYQTDPVYMTQGVVLDDITDPSTMPTAADDPTLVDQDNDGLPGLTIALQGAIDGQTYVAQWDRLELSGSPVSEDRVEGLLTFENRQSMLASEPAFIANVVAAPIPDPDPCRSLFVLVRIPSDADCTWINEQRDVLFPEAPAGN